MNFEAQAKMINIKLQLPSFVRLKGLLANTDFRYNKGIRVVPSLHLGSLEITLTVPLMLLGSPSKQIFMERD